MTKKLKFAVIDSETDPFSYGAEIKPFVWGFYDGENYEEFYETEALVDFIRDKDLIIYAHNGGKFDFHFLLEYIEPHTELMIINGRISKMPIGACELRDSYNIIPAPLSAYKKDEFDYSFMLAENRNKPAVKEKISLYLRNDCIYLWELIDRFHDEYGISLTQAGSSMKQWRKMSIAPVPKTNAAFYADLSKYYFGGRVQCFRQGIINTNFSVYDINSAYPYAMLSKHPYSVNFDKFSGWHAKADFVTVECISRGVFPFRAPSGLIFPDDGIRRVYHVTRWEYDAAVKTDSVYAANILESVVFMGHTDFSEYIAKFWNLRKAAKKAGDDAGSLLYKLAMNSLYGKFASNPENYSVYMNIPDDYVDAYSESGWRFCGNLGPWVLVDAPLPESRRSYYNVATGASITGLVRAMLWEALHSSKGLLYCDTDSIACERAGDAIQTGDAIGQWKLEGNFNRAGIGGKKLYIFESDEGDIKQASKGARLSPSDLWKIAAGETIEYNKASPTFSVNSQMRYITRKIKNT